MKLFPTWKPLIIEHQEIIYHNLQKSNPEATAFINYINKPGGLESLTATSFEDAIEKLLNSDEKIYFIAQEEAVEYYLKQNFSTNMNDANLVSTASMADTCAPILTKNSPWTPILSLGFRKLEEQGIIKKQMNTWMDDFKFTPEAEGLAMDKFYLLFMFLGSFFIFSIIAFGFECFWY